MPQINFVFMHWIKNWEEKKKGLLLRWLKIAVAAIAGFAISFWGNFNWMWDPFFRDLFFMVAFAWSAFLATYVFQLDTKFFAYDPTGNKSGFKGRRLSERIHIHIVHFLGGLIGWAILYFFLHTHALDSLGGWEKLLLGIIVFLSITGYLPYTVIIKNWLPGK